MSVQLVLVNFGLITRYNIQNGSHYNASAASFGAFGHCVTPPVGADLHKTSICITQNTQYTNTQIQHKNTQSQNTKCHFMTLLVGGDLHNSGIAALVKTSFFAAFCSHHSVLLFL